MMNEKIINEQYNHVYDLLQKKRLKEALNQLEAILWQYPNWSLKDRLEQLHTSYKYMLEYMRQGLNDPERKKIYRKLLRDVWEVADQSRLLILDSISAKYYHEIRRTRSSATEHDNANLIHTLTSFNEDIALNDLLPEDQANEALKKHEELLKQLFLSTWTNIAWTSEEEENASKALASSCLLVEDLCLYVSAVMLSLMECFDSRKAIWLLDAYKFPDVNVSQRALVSTLIILHIYRERIKLYPELSEKVKCLAESSPFSEDTARIYHQMLLCQETEKIDKRMREEIIPEMLKSSSSYMRNIRLGLEENEEENSDKNPDWENIIEQSGLGEKLREMNELQLEGADIYMSSFAGLKSYPFFRELQNWFYPFTKQQSEVNKLLNKGTDETNSLLTLILQSGFFSNSDKYSLFFTIQHLPKMQQDLMLNQFREQQANELFEDVNIENLKKISQKPNVVSNQYLHDLYRFFKLNMRRQEFRDIFKEQLDLHHIPVLKDMLYRENVLNSIADFYLKKERWEEATNTYKELIEFKHSNNGNVADFYQKLGFTLQKRKRYKESIDAYLKAEILRPDNVWNNRHLATCYRLTRDFQSALTYYKKVEEAIPEDTNVIFYIGSCLIELEKYEEALNYFFKLDFMESDCIKAWRGIAWCSFICAKYKQAMKYYEKIIEQRPLSIDYLNAGHVAWVMGDIQKAIALYSKSITTNGNREQFIDIFYKDKETLLQRGILEEDIPLMLDLVDDEVGK